MIFFCFGASLLILHGALFSKICRYLPSGSDDEGDLGLGVNVEVSFLLGGSLGIDNILVGLGVLGGVLLGSFSGSLSSGGAILLGLLTSLDAVSEQLGVSSLLLDDVLWDNSCPINKTRKP